MEVNFITSFINYKINYLAQCGLLFYNNCDKKFIFDHLTQYITTYVNNYYYHKSETLDSIDKINDDILLKELYGKKIEILDNFSQYEFDMDNILYSIEKKSLIDMVDVVYFLIKIDRLRFNSKDDIDVKFNELIASDFKMKNMLENRVFKLLLKIKQNYNNENKILTQTGFYKMDCSRFIDNNLIYVSLYHDIALLKNNYRNILVDKVYRDEKYNLDKTSCLIWNISVSILENIINGKKPDNYLMDISNNLFYRGKFLLEEELNNPLLRENVILVFNVNTYKDNLSIINTLKYKVACSVDLSHINDVVEKIKSIEELGTFEYIFINDYKDKDFDTIKNYRCDSSKVVMIKE